MRSTVTNKETLQNEPGKKDCGLKGDQTSVEGRSWGSGLVWQCQETVGTGLVKLGWTWGENGGGI